MIFQQFYLSCLAHASYLIGSEGEAVVVDPQRDVQIYLDEAERSGLLIRYVIETHLHADFVSGHVELANRTGARVCIGWCSGAKFPHIPVHDGNELRVGDVRLRFLETPGHTPESICVLLFEPASAEFPRAVLTGDTLFIGDVGRPDLTAEHTPQQLAGLLYESLHAKLLTLPDEVLVYPAHGAGSLCGRSMSNELSSTIGIQRQSNYAVLASSRADFIRMLTEDLPERPGYFALDAELNRAGAHALSELPTLPLLRPDEFAAHQSRGAMVLDTRPSSQFLAAHIPGSLHIALNGQFASWAGTLLGLNTPVLLVAEDAEHAEESRLRLSRVGIETIAGALAGGLMAWSEAGLPVASIEEMSVEQLHGRIQAGDDIDLIDVRRPAEWNAGHIAEARLLPLNRLAASLDNLDRARPVVVHCQGGYRSAIAASVLERAGFGRLFSITGGFSAWTALQYPVTL